MFTRHAPVCLLALGLLAGPAAAQTSTVGVNFLGTTSTNVNTLNNGFLITPPDGGGAVGPNNFMQYVNGAVAVYTKDGTLVSRVSETSWWRAVSGTGLSTISPAGDPRVYYDPLSNRWFATAFTVPAGGGINNQLLIARSDTANPAGAWSGAILNGTANLFGDFPTLGVDANGVYIGTNNFTSTSGPFQSVSFFAVPKADLLAANPTVARVSRFDGLDPGGAPDSGVGFTLQGIANSSATATSSGMIAISNTAFGQFRATPINWSNGVATLGTTVNAPATPQGGDYPPPAPQSGGTDLDAGDDRVESFAWRIGNLTYVVHGNNVNNRAAPSWLVFDSTSNSLVATGDISDSTLSFIHPSIAANARGDIVISFTGSSPSQFPGVYAVIGTPNIPKSPTSWTFGTPFLVQAGEVTYTDGFSPTRWGDYGSTTLDPADPGVFWIMAERTSTQNGISQRKWGSQIAEIVPPVAGEPRWKTTTNNGSLNFTDTANWFGGTTPGSSDHVIFSRWSPNNYTVNMPSGATSSDRLSVRQTGAGTVTFNLAPGQTWNLGNSSAATPSLAVAEYQGTTSVKFTGGGTLNTVNTIVGGQAGGSGSLTLDNVTWSNTGSAYVGGTSTAAGGTGSLTLANGATGTVGGTLQLWQTSAAVTVNSGTTLKAAGLASPTGTSPTVTVDGGLEVTDGLGATFNGVIAGAGTVTKSGAGTATLTGANTYSGQTTVTGGTLALSGAGSFANTPLVRVNTGGTLSVSGVTGGANFSAGRFTLVNGQSLQGSGGAVAGTVGVLSGSSIAPGTGTTTTGVLTVNGDVAFSSGSKFAVAVNGTAPGTGYGRLAVNGAVSLGNATLMLQSVAGSTFSATDQVFILVNDGLDPISGQFNGLGEGAAVTVGGYNAQISYLGNAEANLPIGGNDVMLYNFQPTPVPEPEAVLAFAAGGLLFAGLARRRTRAADAVTVAG